MVAVFLAANLEGVAPSDAELERLYAQGGHPFTDRPLDDVRAPFRAFVTEQRLRASVERWVGSLRARTAVRIVARYR